MINAASLPRVETAERTKSSYIHVEGPSDSPLAFVFLLLLLFIIYIAPQGYFPALEPLSLGKVSAGLALVVYVTSTFASNRKLTVGGPAVKMILWLFGFALLSVPLSKWPGGSWDFLLNSYSKSIIVFFLVANLLSNETRIRQFFWAISLFCGFDAVIGILNYVEGNFIPEGLRIKGGMSGITSNPNDLALTLNLGIPIMWYLFLTSKRMFLKIAACGIMILTVAAVIVTFSRGGALTLICLIFWYAWNKSGFRKIGRVLGIAVVMLVFVFVGPEGYSDRLESSLDHSMDRSGSANLRVELLKGAIVDTVMHPLGVGVGMNALLQSEIGMGWNKVHNMYLELSTEIGIPAGIIFIVLFVKLIRRMSRLRSMSPLADKERFLLPMAAEGSLLAMAVGGMFHPVAYGFYFYIVAGIAVAVNEMYARNYPSVTVPRSSSVGKSIFQKS